LGFRVIRSCRVPREGLTWETRCSVLLVAGRDCRQAAGRAPSSLPPPPAAPGRVTRPAKVLLSAVGGLVQDRLVAACDLGLVEGGVGGEQGVVVGLGAGVEERATDADGGINPAGPDGV
jgi:hypothetical protein